VEWPFGELIPGRYAAIAVDPPWRFKSNSKRKPGRNAMRHYECMSLDEIAALPVKQLAAPDCALFLWITGPFLALGAHVPIMQTWGFKPSGLGFTWIKLKQGASERLFLDMHDLAMGPGFTTRKNAEFCVIGKRGRSVRQDKGVHEVILERVREHSRKPDAFYKRIRSYVGSAPICELFARERRDGIDGWGNQLGMFNV
jgi:N6-adenosine-specific RNA methylase IME4